MLNAQPLARVRAFPSKIPVANLPLSFSLSVQFNPLSSRASLRGLTSIFSRSAINVRALCVFVSLLSACVRPLCFRFTSHACARPLYYRSTSRACARPLCFRSTPLGRASSTLFVLSFSLFFAPFLPAPCFIARLFSATVFVFGNPVSPLFFYPSVSLPCPSSLVRISPAITPGNQTQTLERIVDRDILIFYSELAIFAYL